MARLLPDPLPPEVLTDPRRAGERRVFEALKTGLNDEWHIFANVSWCRADEHEGFQDGEADAVVVHPDKGMVVLEVKGGDVGRDGVTGHWYSRDRHGADHKLKQSPYEQSRRTAFALRKIVADTLGPDFQRIRCANAVVLPDVARPSNPLGPDAPLELTAFHDELEQIGTKVDEILQITARDPKLVAPGPAGVNTLRELLMPGFDLSAPLAVRIRDDEEQFLTLTESQKTVLSLLSRLRRVAVSGGAGTGKTVLAVEKARQLAAAGADVLFLCFNSALAREVTARCDDLENITVRTFHSWCLQWAREAGTLATEPAESDSPDFWENELPDAMLAALETVEWRFDAIVVDEAQDLRPDWWTHIEFALRNGDDGILYVFHDDNQRIYEKSAGIPGDLAPIPLNENVRNTRAIHDAAAPLYDGGAFVCRGPDGRPPEFLAIREGKSAEREVRSLLHRLVNEEHIAPGDIAVLGARALARSNVGNTGKIGPFECVPLAGARPGAIVRDSIHRFKGLERPVVILVELEQALQRSELLYVGLTRARSHIILVDAAATLDKVRFVAGLTAASA